MITKAEDRQRGFALFPSEYLPALLSVAVGSALYIAFRPSVIILFDLFDLVGASRIVFSIRELVSDIKLPDWALYSLPTGLWSFSFLYYNLCVWKDVLSCRSALTTILFVILCVEAIEPLQAYSILPGTFDVWDAVANTLGLLGAGALFYVKH
jgi:hypothetical protein